MILVPIAIVLMILIPQNRILLAVDLAVLPFMVVHDHPHHQGQYPKDRHHRHDNHCRWAYGGNPHGSSLYRGCQAAQFEMPSGATMISSICDGSNLLTWVMVQLMRLSWFGALVLFLIGLWARLPI
jgi:PTS system galactitol-specific IIC component